MEKLKLKNDRYRKARGGYARLLSIFCEKCGAKIAIYQKDGPGELKRLYLDRIFEPKLNSIRKGQEFKCPKCKFVLGVFYNYPKEKRPAIRLYQGAVNKKIIKQ